MSDIIRLLPETVANQIAAGEVIQRPASAVKELVENAVDAGSTKIELFTKESGKTSIRIVDNGTGMSPTDARLSFSRHATSKICSAEDLFAIHTKGFRGEALASISAVAQVELKTRRLEDETGTLIQIEGNTIKLQEPVSTAPGTSITIRNLFFNIPARRNFLKSDSIEGRHIIEEFERIALAHPEVAFSLTQNGVEIFKLPLSNLRQRIVNINGSHYNERLVPVNEDTTLLTINGFVGKPEFSKKTRGEQYLFVNKRYVRDGYLNHAVSAAFEELLPKDSFASYWLYIDIAPARIDVNIHPTKTEIKFDDERAVYAIVRSAIKRSLGQYNVSPALDFEREPTFDIPHHMRNQPVVRPGVTVNTDFNPFQREKNPIASAGWEKLYEGVRQINSEPLAPLQERLAVEITPLAPSYGDFIQISNYIICRKNEMMMIVDAPAAHERIIFDRVSNASSLQEVAQQELFPQTVNFSAGDFQLVKEIENDLRTMGFDLREFGLYTYVLHSTPAGIEKGNEIRILESVLEQYKNNSNVLSTGTKEKIAYAIAKSMAIKKGMILSYEEMLSLIREIELSPKGKTGIDGKRCVTYMTPTELSEKFK